MARIEEGAVVFPYDEDTLPEGRLAVPSCDENMVVIKIRPHLSGVGVANLSQRDRIYNIETGWGNFTGDRFRLLAPGTMIHIAVGGVEL